MIWNPTVECMSRAAREELQLERLRISLARAYETVPYYRKTFDAAGILPNQLKSLEDLAKFPLTTKDDLREVYPFGMFAVPLKDIVEIHTSSGTTGKPVVAGYTRNDIFLWGEVMARCLTMAGADKNDIVQNGYGYGLFTGGLGVHYGASTIGATVIPVSAGNTRRQLQVMRDFGTTILTCTPSYALYLAESAEAEGIDLSSLKLKAGCFGAEMWTDSIRVEIEERLNVLALDIYGLTEIIGPGVGHECREKNGLHIFEDHFYPEVISSSTLNPLHEGEKGELVITTLTREGMPMIRFRTKDLTELYREECKCGRTMVRMERITGRADDMLKIRGVMVFPSQIEQALLEVDGVEPQYQIIVTRPHHLDELEIQVEAAGEIFSDEVRRVEEMRMKIEKHIDSQLGIRVKVTLVEPKTLPRSEGKAMRVIDKREM
ncbi:MAG: phenylacetate--CoA ligase [Candidatus Ratteibacteria bacterium]|jgi:phenylacetate-CoA ligase